MPGKGNRSKPVGEKKKPGRSVKEKREAKQAKQVARQQARKTTGP